MPQYDAVVVGAGPNGLVAAIVLAQAGRSVLLREANEAVGGAVRTMPLTLPGFVHDACASTFPLAVGAPIFRELPLEEHGLEWIYSPAAVAHPLDDGSAVTLESSVVATGEGLGADAEAYRQLLTPFVRRWDELAPGILGPLRVPRHPFLLARFGWYGIRSAECLIRRLFSEERARALFAGNAAHSGLRIDATGSAAYGLVLLATGHAVGWPIARGGAGAVAEALAARLRALGGEIETGSPVERLEELPSSRCTLLDLTPRQILTIAGDRLPRRYRSALLRYRYGPGVFKIDWALREPVPWRAAECRRAATVHLGGSAAEIARSERHVWSGTPSERPFVLLGQPSLFDATRAPKGRHTAWAYCHLPNGSDFDMTERIEAQVERYAPGFRDLILARHILQPADLERLDANLVGGDINGGSARFDQFFFRPVVRANPYATPVDGLFLCSASTPPGGGVHGMCGFHAAQAALDYLGRIAV